VPSDELTEPPRLAETHSAIVVLLGNRAYKLKKPVDLGFLDFSTRAAREAIVHREVELNRRLAPDVYLGVADVTGPDGELCDHLLVMRRMPEDRRLATLVRRGLATDEQLREIARAVAAFHSRAARSAAIAAAGSPSAIAAKLERDLDDLDAYAGDPLRYLAGRRALLETRVRAGCICDGHGDLLADDVFCLADGPRILDCIEFDDALRYGDVLADVAFLAMDLEHLGASDLARSFLRWYGEFSDEHHPESLADWYVAFRALIRAKVACVRYRQGDTAAADRARELLTLAGTRLRHGRVTLVVVGGAPGTGKSTLAAGVARARGWALLGSDVVRKELAGLPADADATAALRQGLYDDATTAATYGELLRRAGRALELGESVVLDASWTRAADRDRAAGLGAATASRVVELRCEAPPELAEARISARRRAGTGPSDATPEVARALRAGADPWPSAVPIDTTGPEESSLRRALEALER
jgi:uncharacterized protein